MLPPAIMVAWKCLPGVLGLVWAMAERYGVQKAVATKLVDSAFKDKYSGCKKHPKEIEAELINAKAKLKEAETKLKEAETKEKEAEAKQKANG